MSENDEEVSSVGAGVLGHGLGSLRHGVLGELSGKDEADSGLDIPGDDGGPLVVLSQLGSLQGNLVEDVVGERVHDTHGLGGDPGVRMDLLEHLEDEGGEGVILLLPLGLLSHLGSRAASLLLDNLRARSGNLPSGSGDILDLINRSGFSNNNLGGLGFLGSHLSRVVGMVWFSLKKQVSL